MKSETDQAARAGDYEKLGRNIEKILVTDYIDSLHSTPRQLWNGFMRGAMAGLGGVIGATVGVAALLFLLQHVGTHLPLVGHYFRTLSQTINTKAIKTK